jgi:hypothetical protein
MKWWKAAASPPDELVVQNDGVSGVMSHNSCSRG